MPAALPWGLFSLRVQRLVVEARAAPPGRAFGGAIAEEIRPLAYPRRSRPARRPRLPSRRASSARRVRLRARQHLAPGHAGVAMRCFSKGFEGAQQLVAFGLGHGLHGDGVACVALNGLQQELDLDGLVREDDPAPSARSSTPALSGAVTSPWTALTSRSARRAASRMDTRPAPQRAFSSSQRLAVRTFHSSSGVAKLMRADRFRLAGAPGAGELGHGTFASRTSGDCLHGFPSLCLARGRAARRTDATSKVVTARRPSSASPTCRNFSPSISSIGGAPSLVWRRFRRERASGDDPLGPSRHCPRKSLTCDGGTFANWKGSKETGSGFAGFRIRRCRRRRSGR